MNTAKQITLERAMVIKNLMPDTCKLYPRKAANYTISGGVMTPGTITARLWRGVTTIPCRADLSRAFRPDKLKTQATEVDEFNLELPYDVVFDPSDYVIINYKGIDHRFEIRKIKDMSNWDVSVECVIDQTGTDFDYT